MIDVFMALPPPSTPGAYSVGPETGHCRIGRSFEGNPALLVSFTNVNGRQLQRKLTNFAYTPPAPVNVRSGDTSVAAELAIVECRTHDRQLAKYFFRIAADVLAPEAVSGEEARFERAVDAVITLFKALQRPATETIQGVWAELAIILWASDVEVAAKSWHSKPRSLHDFVNSGHHLEVKSTTRGMREHRFSLDQLRLKEAEIVLVASVLLTETSGGLSVLDLVSAIQAKLATHESRRRIETIVAESLGSTLSQADEHCFDLDAARNALLFYRAEDIPTCGPVPPEVTEVAFTANLAAVPPLDIETARSISAQFRDLLPGADVRPTD